MIVKTYAMNLNPPWSAVQYKGFLSLEAREYQVIKLVKCSCLSSGPQKVVQTPASAKKFLCNLSQGFKDQLLASIFSTPFPETHLHPYISWDGANFWCLHAQIPSCQLSIMFETAFGTCGSAMPHFWYFVHNNTVFAIGLAKKSLELYTDCVNSTFWECITEDQATPFICHFLHAIINLIL